MSRPQLRSISLCIYLFAWLLAAPALAASLEADKYEIPVGEVTNIRLESGAAFVSRSASPELQTLSPNRDGARVKGISPGTATIDAKWLTGRKSAQITVKSAESDTSGRNTTDWGNSGPALQRLSFDQRRMADLMRNANQALTRGEAPDAVARQFYADLAKLNIPTPMVALNDLKKRLTDTGLADAALGERFEAGGTPVERALLVYRRDLTMDSIRAAVAEVARSHGVDTGSIFLAKIGKWAVQNPDMFTLAGDIDFSFVGARPEIILALRDAYKRQITERSGGLDMVAIDSVATAHGFAEHMVYMGIQGRKFADDAMMGMDQGVEQIDFRNPDATGTSAARQVSGKQALIETVLEETGRHYRENGYEEKGRSLANEIERTWDDRRNQTVEPMLSMEMARHLEHDIIKNVDVFAAIDIIKKGAKYLRRSNDQTTGDLKIDPADAAWAKFVVDVDEMAKTAKAEDLVKFIDAETKKLGIAGFEMIRVDGKAMLVAAPGAAEAFLAKAKQMIWSNVSNGMDVRIRALTDAFNNRGQAAGPGTLDDLRPERLADTLRMLTAGLEVMKQEHSAIPRDIVTKASVLAKLIEGYGGRRGYPLPKEEIDKLRKLLDEAIHNDTTLLLKMGAAVSHIDQWLVKNYDSMSARLPASRQLSMADAKIDALNSLLDGLDDSLLGALREKGVLELDLGPGPDGKPRLHATTFPRIAAINQRLNQSVLGRIGNNTAFKAFNLAQEGDAYYSAIMQATTPSEAFSNVATEIFRRRVPGGGMVEALVMENYTRAGIEVVYTIFPPLAVPEGLYGMGASFYEARRQEWWQAELETMIDGLYETTEFAKDSASPGHYPLTHVTYKQVRYSRKGLEEGKSFILDPDVDKTLTEILRAGDSFLTLMAELENHGAAGDKVRANFRAKADQRWIEVKRDFVRHMIDKLEKRHDAEVADLTGQISGIYAELMAAAEKLQIRDQVVKRMDAEWDSNNLKSFWTWLKNVGRQGAWGGTLAETERNKAAAIVMRYRNAYRSVLAARERLEGEIARTLENTGQPVEDVTQHKQRLLTGIVFFTGENERDKQVAMQWAGQAGRSEQQTRDELVNIKARYMPGTALDTPFDNATLGQVFFEDIWIEALKFMKVPVISAASFKRAADTRKARRTALVKAFEIYYANQTGTATVHVLRQGDSRGTGIERARVVVKAGQAELRPVDRGNGIYTLAGLTPGSYAVSASAEGYKSADGKPVATAKLTMPPRSDPTRMGEATLLMAPGKTDALSVSIDASPADRRIRSSGPNSQAVLKAHVVGHSDSGKLRFQWAVGKQVLDQGEGKSSTTLRGEGHAGKDVTVSVIVIDARDREGTASVVISVAAGEDIPVALAPHRGEIGKNEDETVEVSEPIDGDVKYKWTVSEDGGYRREYDGVRKYVVNGAYNAGKTVTLTVRATTKDGRSGSATTTVRVKDEEVDTQDMAGSDTSTIIQDIRAPADPRVSRAIPAAFSVTAPSIWQGVSDNRGFNVRRTLAKGGAIAEMCPYPASAWGEVSGKIGPSFAPRSLDDIRTRLEEEKLAHKKYGLEAEIQPFAIGDFKGLLLETKLRYVNGGWSHSGYRDSGVDANGHGWVQKEGKVFEVSYGIASNGCWNNSQRPFQESQARAAQAEARAILAGLRLVEQPTLAHTPYRGPKLDGSDLPVVRLVRQGVQHLKKGDRFEVRVVVDNARPEDAPFSYAWDGKLHAAADTPRQTATVTVSADQPGKHALSVVVGGQQYELGSARLEYEVADIKVQVERVPPGDQPVPAGGTARLRAVMVSDGKPVQGIYLYRWQPSTEVAFSPTENTGASETTATFTQPGRQVVWVEVLERRGSMLASVADSERLQLDVVNPRLELAVEPASPLVGQETRVSVRDLPRLDDKLAGFRWEYRGDALQPGAGPDPRVFSFRPKSAAPFTAQVQAYLRNGNVDLGSAETVIQPSPYEVKISPAQARGPQLQIWVCETQFGQAQACGMKAIPQGQFATFQDIYLQAGIAPAAKSPRYLWTVEPSGSCGQPGAGSELRLNCSTTGSYTVRLQVFDPDKILLGQAETIVSVTVSDRDVKQAPRSKDASDKLQQARQRAVDGQIDEAIKLAEAASVLDPKNTEARDLAKRWNDERQAIRQQLDIAAKALLGNKPDAAQKAVDAARKLHPRYPPLLAVEKQIAEARRKAEAVVSNANVAGNWTVNFEYRGKSHAHDMNIRQRDNGSIDGNGGHPAGKTYDFAWVIKSGSVTGRSIDFDADYTLGAAGTTMRVSGKMNPDGSMTGTWTDNYGGQSRSGTWGARKSSAGPDAPTQIARKSGTAGTERWKVRLDPGSYFSTFELRIDGEGRVDGLSHWTCCSGPINRITGRITPAGDIQLTRHLEGSHTGMSHEWKGRYAADRKTIEGTWSSGSYGHGSGPWRADVEAWDGATPSTMTGATASPLAGQWRITAHGYPGTIEFTPAGGRWTGRENIDGTWEPITDIFFDAGAGRVEFTRPRVAQRYKGTLSAKGMTGTFDQSGAGQYVWGATR